jgi:hypothetical protein
VEVNSDRVINRGMKVERFVVCGGMFMEDFPMREAEGNHSEAVRREKRDALRQSRLPHALTFLGV